MFSEDSRRLAGKLGYDVYMKEKGKGCWRVGYRTWGYAVVRVDRSAGFWLCG